MVNRNRDATREIGGIKNLCDLLASSDEEKVCTLLMKNAHTYSSRFTQIFVVYTLLLFLGSREYLLGTCVSLFR